MKSGIYIITCLINNKIYIGRSKNWKKRLNDHKNTLIKNNHANEHLQNAINLYGIENFTFELLEEWESEFLCSMENYWCNLLNSHNREYGYNIEPTSPFGKLTHSEKTRKKLSSRIITEEWKLKNSISKKGIVHSEEYKQNMSISCKGISKSEEAKRNISKGHTGLKQTKEHTKNHAISISIPIVQLSLNNEFIEKWESATQAEKYIDISQSAINNVVNGKKKSVKGFKWMKLEDYKQLNNIKL